MAAAAIRATTVATIRPDRGPRGADRRPRVTDTLGPQWGLHGDDVNLALGNLVGIVAREEAAYR